MRCLRYFRQGRHTPQGRYVISTEPVTPTPVRKFRTNTPLTAHAAVPRDLARVCVVLFPNSTCMMAFEDVQRVRSDLLGKSVGAWYGHVSGVRSTAAAVYRSAQWRTAFAIFLPQHTGPLRSTARLNARRSADSVTVNQCVL